MILFRYLKLTRDFLKKKDKFKSIIVGFPGHYDAPLAFILGKIFGKKVFFDIFASTYETYVLDRKVVSPKSFRAKFYYFIDWLGLHLSDYVVVDTIAHGKFYNRLYKINPIKQIVVYVGYDNDFFYPRKTREETDVLFYGSYQPLQGTEVIIYAASQLPKVKFKMIGDGQTRKDTEDLARSLNLKNVEFVNWLPLKKLAEEITRAKICLGIFGATKKASVVIPNKVYDAIACRKPVISADTRAINEIYSNKNNIYLVKPENPDELSKAVSIILKKNHLMNTLSEESFRLYSNFFKADRVVRPLVNYLR